jgi:hypothetical protein
MLMRLLSGSRNSMARLPLGRRIEDEFTDNVRKPCTLGIDILDLEIEDHRAIGGRCIAPALWASIVRWLEMASASARA